MYLECQLMWLMHLCECAEFRSIWYSENGDICRATIDIAFVWNDVIDPKKTMMKLTQNIGGLNNTNATV